jgi:hypothetical protein
MMPLDVGPGRVLCCGCSFDRDVVSDSADILLVASHWDREHSWPTYVPVDGAVRSRCFCREDAEVESAL